MNSLFGGLTHFQACGPLRACCVRCVRISVKRRALERAEVYLIRTFLAFLLVAIGIGWLMYPFSQ